MSSPATASLLEFSVGTFAPYVGQSFAVSLEPGGAQVATFTLEEAVEVGPAQGTQRAPFSLIFDGPADIELEQQIMWLGNPQLGTAGIFLVPISADADKRRYQAVFN